MVGNLGRTDTQWWRHQMETLSALLALCAGNSPVTGEFPSQRPVTRSFDVFFDMCLNKRLSKQSRGWWIETPSRPIWRHHKASSGYKESWVKSYYHTLIPETNWNGKKEVCSAFLGVHSGIILFFELHPKAIWNPIRNCDYVAIYFFSTRHFRAKN